MNVSASATLCTRQSMHTVHTGRIVEVGEVEQGAGAEAEEVDKRVTIQRWTASSIVLQHHKVIAASAVVTAFTCRQRRR